MALRVRRKRPSNRELGETLARELERVAKLTPAKALVTMGRLEERHSAGTLFPKAESQEPDADDKPAAPQQLVNLIIQR